MSDMTMPKELRDRSCFDNLAGKDIYVFGAGGIKARKFFAFYGYEYPIKAALDNNQTKWGKDFFGTTIASPDILKDIDPESYVLILANREPDDVYQQMVELGAKDIRAYDSERIYPGRQDAVARGDKKYHIGYVAGVFDLYHVGHLNMFRRAKEQCDYLIVGVTSDEYCRLNKRKEPVVPFDERIDLVNTCQFVDEAVPIPYEFGGTVEAFQKYHFDVQFSGSDYTTNQWWLDQQAYLREHGSDLVFFPYTEKTSSTMIRNTLTGGVPTPSAAQQPKTGKVAYFPTIIEPGDWHQLNLFKEIAAKYGRLFVGIPDDVSTARLLGPSRRYNAVETRDYLQQFPWIEQVIVLDKEHLSRRRIYQDLKFDVVYYGHDYGKHYHEELWFWEDNGVEYVNLTPAVYTHYVPYGDALLMAIENLRKDQKVVLFGTGKYFDNYMAEYASHKPSHAGKIYAPAYAVDNDSSKWGTYKDGIEIKSPEVLREEDLENTLVVLASANYIPMIEQLDKLVGIGNVDYRTMKRDNRIAALDEFYIAKKMEDEYMTRCHAVILPMLKEFDRVCQKHGISYYMVCGSLIGALRHKGVIPWDDDMDVAMTREDYNKLLKVSREEWDPKEYMVLDPMDLGDVFLDFMPRFFGMTERLPMKVYDKVGDRPVNYDVVDRPFIDIYVMDNAADDEKKHQRMMSFLKRLYGLCMGHRGLLDYSEYEGDKDQSFVKTLKLANKVGRALPLKLLMKLYMSIVQKYNKKLTTHYFMSSCAITVIDRKFDKNNFCGGQRVPFEDFEVTIPKEPHAQMEAMGYRGYMIPIEEEKRKPSHYFNSDITIWN